MPRTKKSPRISSSGKPPFRVSEIRISDVPRIEDTIEYALATLQEIRLNTALYFAM